MEKVGIFTIFDNRPMRPMAVPSEASAETIGSAMAQMEPNTSSNTSPASRTPPNIPPTAGLLAWLAIWPEMATVRSFELPFSTRSTKALDCCSFTWNGETAKVTLAKAIRPSAEICRAPAALKGEMT